ncbi:unnamed protein product, partial [Polarella glacialis]
DRADKLRAALRRTLHRLEAAVKTTGCGRDVQELLERRPDLVAKLRVLWGVTGTATADMEDAVGPGQSKGRKRPLETARSDQEDVAIMCGGG